MKLRVSDHRAPPEAAEETPAAEPPKAGQQLSEELLTPPNNAPHSPELEGEVLGSMILDMDVREYALEVLKPADFYGETNRRIYRAVATLTEQEGAMDITLILDEMRRQRGFQGGDLAHLMGVCDLPSSAVFGYQKVDRLKEYGDQRIVMRAAEEVASEAMKNGSKAALAKLETLLPQITTVGGEIDRAKEMARRYANGQAQVATGYVQLDRHTNGGLPRGDTTFIFARSSIGKSQFLYPIADHIGASQGEPFDIITPDANISEILAAEAARRSNTPLTSLRNPLTGRQRYLSEVNNLENTFLKNVRLHQGAVTVADIERIVRRAIRLGSSGFAIDTMNRVSYGREGKTAMLAELGSLMKGLAIEFNIPAIGLGQIRREVDERENKRPTSADIADAPGSLYNDANMILFLYRDGRYYPSDSATEPLEVIVEKHKLGRTNYYVKLAYERALARVYDPKAEKPREHGLFGETNGTEAKDKPKAQVPAQPPRKG